MFRPALSVLLTAVLVLSQAQASRAGIVISFDPAVTEVTIPFMGSTGFTVTVRMRADAGTAAVGGYDIPIDLSSPAGSGLPAGWTIAGFTKLKDFGSEVFFPGPLALTPDEGDFLVGDASLAGRLDFGIDPVPLFSFTVDVTSAAQPGEFTASVVEGALLAIEGFSRNEIAIENSALIRTTAVPEPSGLGILAAASILFFRRRQWSPR